MYTLFCIYMIGALIWAYQVEVKKTKGFFVKIGTILYFPFVALVLLINKDYKITPK